MGGTAQVGRQSRGERVLESVGQAAEVKVFDVASLGEDSGGGQKSGGNSEKRNGALDIDFESLGFGDDESTNDGSGHVTQDALGVEKSGGGGCSLQGSGGSNGRVGPGTGDSGGSHLRSSCEKSGKCGTVDGTRVEGEKHTHAHGGLVGKGECDLPVNFGGNRENGLHVGCARVFGYPGLTVRCGKTGNNCQKGGEKHKDLHCDLVCLFQLK
mmetsp:Transcript_28715/g.61627  ORF Transcript_28715/g.61627 Transcript_28715/m.61627 type:complete len:212 (-) Transcript_28715:172-807(-)